MKKSELTKYKDKAQSIFNAYIRERDRDLDGKWTCICCGNRIDKPNAAHYAPVKLYPTLRFDEQNVNVSCIFCNRTEGNSIGYRRGLIKKIGEKAVINLETKALDPNKRIVWDIPSLKMIINKYEKNTKNPK